jgi:hypothetical protein
VSRRGFEEKGRRYRLRLGVYPAMSLEAARARANEFLAQVKAGESPVLALERAPSPAVSPLRHSRRGSLRTTRARGIFVRPINTNKRSPRILFPMWVIFSQMPWTANTFGI